MRYWYWVSYMFARNSGGAFRTGSGEYMTLEPLTTLADFLGIAGDISRFEGQEVVLMGCILLRTEPDAPADPQIQSGGQQ
jgi:hypothetical protein